MNNSPEPKPSFSINLGDVLELGEHRLACGDAKDPLLVEKLLEGEAILRTKRMKSKKMLKMK
jgi:hypothetical protein